MEMNYLDYKFFQIFFLDEDFRKEILQSLDITTIERLNALIIFLEKNEKTGFFDSDNIEIVYDIAQNIRLKIYDDLEKIVKYDLVNEIIRLANVTTLEKSQRFIYAEYSKRYFDAKREQKFEKFMISNDYPVLYSLAYEDELELEQFCLDDWFIGSVNAILTECPKILSFSNLKSNLMKILNYNLKLCDEYRKYDINRHDAKYLKYRTSNLIGRVEKIKKI